MDYKSVFTNLCLELQQNRSWIKGLGKNPQKSELIHWRQCLLSGGTEACSLGLWETPACIHVIQRLSQPRMACWHGFWQNSLKTECVFTRCPTGGRKKIACIYGLRSEGVKTCSECTTDHLECKHFQGPLTHRMQYMSFMLCAGNLNTNITTLFWKLVSRSPDNQIMLSLYKQSTNISHFPNNDFLHFPSSYLYHEKGRGKCHAHFTL